MYYRMNGISLAEQYKTTRQLTEKLCAPLATEDYIPQPVVYVSPPRWHIAHVTWFFEEMILKKHLQGYREFHPEFSFLFNSYYNNIGDRTHRDHRGFMTRPGISEIFDYRAHVDKHIQELLSREIDEEISALVTLGINHEQQHQELFLTDLQYILSLNPLNPVYRDGLNLVGDRNTEAGFLQIDEGLYNIGFSGESFCYDNELQRHKVYLGPFDISKALVTNGEYIEFIEAGGYTNFNHWLDDGWTWIKENNINAPLYWRLTNNRWSYYTFAGLREIDPEAILTHVSYYEANAYATWKGMRLPTEFEWEAASPLLSWGQRWEWTNSAYLPYPGFSIARGALGEYNGKFMVNQMVLRGASIATSPGHSRHTYRNFFHPQYQWQFSGIRLVKK
ncbi:MAG TPA: ergothioneine biosynthesis protein EgtB [Flavipsychrobacter sp.]|nr:ergothioneine biosynthesis protein EgtB [Flavipsychrobacter sp.]